MTRVSLRIVGAALVASAVTCYAGTISMHREDCRLPEVGAGRTRFVGFCGAPAVGAGSFAFTRDTRGIQKPMPDAMEVVPAWFNQEFSLGNSLPANSDETVFDDEARFLTDAVGEQEAYLLAEPEPASMALAGSAALIGAVILCRRTRKR